MMIYLVLALLLGGAPATVAASQPQAPPSVEHLEAFARLYGYVRFFYPGDEASRFDWDRFAIHGARRVAGASDPAELRAALEELFRPVAPAVRLYSKGEAPEPPAVADAAGKVLVSWQHRGVGLAEGTAYESARLHRRVDPAALTNMAARYLYDRDYNGHRFRLSARVRARATGEASGGRLFLDALGERGQSYVLEDMRDRPVTGTAWQRVEIAGVFTEETSFVTYGFGLGGVGEACFDDVRLEVAGEEGEWRDLEVGNAGFEEEEGGVPRRWDFEGYGYRFTVSAQAPFSGDRSGCIRSEEGHVPGSLFAARAGAGEEVDKALAAGLRVRMPLALWLDPEPEAAAPVPLAAALAAIDMEAMTAEDPAVRIAAVTIAWNVFQHFYPYFDVIGTDWGGVLTEALHDAVEDRSTSDLLGTLRRLLAALEDGHAGVMHREFRPGVLDVELAWIEDRVVVVAPREVAALSAGDVVESIDGVPAALAVEQRMSELSGSPQWRRHRALATLAAAPPGTRVELAVQRGAQAARRVAVQLTFPPPLEARETPVRELGDGVWYVDLRWASMEEIDTRIEELAAARGVVFDLRGYPNGNHDVLRYLTDEPLQSAKWQVPQVIYPDGERLAGYDASGRWTLDPRAPRFRGRAVFLTDARAISYAESVLGIVEHYRLGEIVGQPTAGTNGNINRWVLPGGFHVVWTGMRVVKHDDSRHHLVGILPTVPVVPTLAGVRAGRDEVLERALEVLEED